MTATKLDLVEKIHHGIDPFAFNATYESQIDFHGWNSDHVYLTETIEPIRPNIVVEIGVWKGGSTLTMAKALQRLGKDSAIIAIDTFRGSPEHWCEPELFKMMNVQNGLPTIYQTFIANVTAKGLQEFVVPLPVDSYSAYEILKRKDIKPDLVHIDGGHEYKSVMEDLNNWSQLLSPKGAIIMDDYIWDDEKQIATGWPDVAKAVNDFMDAHKSKTTLQHHEAKCLISFENN